jgi:magnesium-transporting ATPase (P-type)
MHFLLSLRIFLSTLCSAVSFCFPGCLAFSFWEDDKTKNNSYLALFIFISIVCVNFLRLLLDIIFVLVPSLEKLIEWVLLGWVIKIRMMMSNKSINDDAAPTCGYHMMAK